MSEPLLMATCTSCGVPVLTRSKKSITFLLFPPCRRTAVRRRSWWPIPSTPREPSASILLRRFFELPIGVAAFQLCVALRVIECCLPCTAFRLRVRAGLQEDVDHLGVPIVSGGSH